MNTKTEIRKRLDTNLGNSRLAKSNVTVYWANKRFRELWKLFRPGFSKMLTKVADPFDQDGIVKKFHLAGFEYGNWLSQEDRFNYFLACEIALFDLQDILKFGYNLGFDTLGIAFGARGKSAASGHFEPDTFMINLPRYKEIRNISVFSSKNETTDREKESLFIRTGGVSSLAHEYAHFLDYFFGGGIEQDRKRRKFYSLTQGVSVDDKPKIDYPENSLRFDANMIIHKLIWQSETKYTSYFSNLKNGIEKNIISTYWIHHCELFARAFEVYVQLKLREKGVKNLFLVRKKYDGSWEYPDRKLMNNLIPHFDSLIRKMRQKL